MEPDEDAQEEYGSGCDFCDSRQELERLLREAEDKTKKQADDVEG